NARCYICMDHTFNDVGSSWGAKSFMASFDKLVNADGANVKWNLAFHAYPANLRRADTWNDTGINNSAAKTPYVTPKNLNVLTKYVKKTYGSDCRIILSEQGFTASSGTSIQAAAMAYTYYKAEFDNMIDAVIFRSDIDALEETKQGLYFGLLTAEHVKRQAYDVYKYMDTPRYAQYTAGLLSEIGVSSWGSVAKGFSESKLLSMPDIQ
ncbi:MAG: hypothetical protein J5842_05055, partial [Lachnospiraceae bacterium]|nr:hypothetical protein [Lachnospiraceae bacterium]